MNRYLSEAILPQKSCSAKKWRSVNKKERERYTLWEQWKGLEFRNNRKPHKYSRNKSTKTEHRCCCCCIITTIYIDLARSLAHTRSPKQTLSMWVLEAKLPCGKNTIEPTKYQCAFHIRRKTYTHTLYMAHTQFSKGIYHEKTTEWVYIHSCIFMNARR